MYTEIFQQILIGFAIIILCAVSDGANASPTETTSTSHTTYHTSQ